MKTDSVSYFYFKFSLQDFGKPVHELTDEQRLHIAEKAEAEQQLHQLILSQPEAAQIVIDDKTVAQALQVISSRYTDLEEFKRDLEKNDIDEQLLQNGLRDELAVNSVLKMVGQAARRVSKEEAREYFQNNSLKFTRPELRTVRQILITVDEDGPEKNRRQTSHERLTSIRERLLANASTFATEAATYSECPSALNKGLLGTLPKGKLYPQLDEALFSLASSELSEIIETELGFHLLCCDEIQPADIISWDNVATRVRERLQDECEQRHARDWIRSIKNR